MADDLEKFVLTYEVQMKDAISRLEQLNRQVEKTHTSSNAAGKELKHFTAGAASELDKLVPGLNKVTLGIRAMSSEFAAAAVGVGVLGAGVAAFMKMREDYNQQRQVGMTLGVSSTRVEDYQRQLIGNNKGGNLDRQKVLDNLGQVRDFASGAYRDPAQMNQQAKMMKLLGISPGERLTNPPKMNDVLTKLATKFAGMSDAQARGIGQDIGLSQDFASSLRRAGPNIGRISMSADEVNNRASAEQGLNKFNEEFTKLQEKFLELTHIIGTELMPGFTSFVEWMGKLAGSAKQISDREASKGKEAWIESRAGTLDGARQAQKRKAGLWSGITDIFSGSDVAAQRAERAQAEREYKQTHVDMSGGTGGPESAKGASKEDVNKLVEKLDKENETGVATADNMQLAVNMFASSVATFSNAISEQQAWAAWAGELGKANGLVGPGGAAPGNGASAIIPSSAGTSAAYDVYFAEAAKKYNVPIDLLKNIARVESGFRPGIASSQGAQGLMQVEPANFKALGITDGYDPRQNIMGGTQLFAQYLKASGGDVTTALKMYHGGPNRGIWGPKTEAYPGMVLAGSNAGFSRADVNKRLVQKNIADALQMPLNQFQQGGATRGDVAFTEKQLEGEYQNNIAHLMIELQTTGKRQADYAKIRTDLRDAARGLDIMRKYGPEVINENSRAGGQVITEGAREVTINLNGGVYDEKLLADLLAGHVNQHFGDVSNSNATAVKR